jgi:ribosome-associated protein
MNPSDATLLGAETIPDNKLANSSTSLKLAVAAAQTAVDNAATDVVILDMTGITALFDYFVIATGTSQRQLNAIADEIQHRIEKDLNDKRLSNHAVERSSWIVLDYGNVVVHLFDEETRAFYSLEALWGDSPRVDWQSAAK